MLQQHSIQDRMSASIDSWSAFDYLWIVWSFLGINPPPIGTPRRGRYVFYGCTINFVITFVFPFTVIIETFLSKSLVIFCTNMYIAIIDSLTIIKFTHVFLIRHRLLSLKPLLAYLDRRVRSAEECAAVSTNIHLAKRVFVWIARLFVCVLVSSVPQGFLAKEKRLMFPGWFPWNYRSTFYAFVLTYCLQAIFFFVRTMQALGNDTYTQVSMIVVAGHIKALGVRIRNIGAATSFDLHLLSPQAQDAAYSQLIECIRDHEVILELLNTIQGITSTACFFQFCCTAFAQCTLGVTIVSTEWNPSSMLYFVLFFLAISAETFIFCYAGDVVCYESEQLTNAIYSCNWYMQHVKFRRALVMLLRRSQKLSVIMAAGFIPVRIPTFIAVMRGAYSMFTMLRRTNRKS